MTDSESFKSKIQITGNTPANGNTEDVEIAVPLKYLRNFWRTLEMPVINCEINLVLTWSSTCVITISTGVGSFVITGTTSNFINSRYAKLLQQLKSGFRKSN